jgi:hypothetical protein
LNWWDQTAKKPATLERISLSVIWRILQTKKSDYCTIIFLTWLLRAP